MTTLNLKELEDFLTFVDLNNEEKKNEIFIDVQINSDKDKVIFVLDALYTYKTPETEILRYADRVQEFCTLSAIEAKALKELGDSPEETIYNQLKEALAGKGYKIKRGSWIE